MFKSAQLYSDVLRIGINDFNRMDSYKRVPRPHVQQRSNNSDSLKLQNRFDPLVHLDEPKEHCFHKKKPTDNTKNNILKACVWNAQSLRQKTELVKNFGDEFDLDLFLFTETWLKADDIVEIGNLERNGEYVYMGTPREGRPGGGVGCILRSGLKAKKINSTKTKTFEHMEIQINLNGKTITILLVYRPEPSNKNKYRLAEFFEEFTQFLAQYQTYHNEVVITGDFNFHINKPDDARVKQFNSILEMYDLEQHVSSPTHKDGNTLDLVITRKNSTLRNCAVSDLLSDHNCVLFNMAIGKVKSPQTKIAFRKLRNLNLNLFKKDIDQHMSQKVQQEKSSEYLSKLVLLYNSSTKVLDKHAPLITKQVTLRKQTSFINADIKNLKTAKRKAERTWRRTGLERDWQEFQQKRNALNDQLNQLKSDDLRAKIESTKGNSKAMFKVLNSNLNRKQELPLPNHENSKDLANDFNTFFDEKIKKIRTQLDSGSNNTAIVENFRGNKLSQFKTLSESAIKKLIGNMPVKHCQLDPIPTWLLLECIDEFLPLITEIVNTSLSLGEMPLDLKHALVKPLLKKGGLDLIKKNYRPVSNLSFLGKIIESAVIKQYMDHLVQNKLDDDKQSAYKQFHSTETLLTKIHNDIMLNMSKGEITMLVLLDLSAAFDTIDHDILLARLENRYGVCNSALNWFQSYISERSQSVLINDQTSDKLHLKFGVPQGSKLGPILFNSYIAPLSEVASQNQIEDQKYADDEQLIISFKPNITDQEIATEKIEKCITEIRKFLHENKLCNNGDKTELLLIGTPHQLNKLQVSSIKVDNVSIKTAENVRNLGVTMDKNMTMEKQVNKNPGIQR